MRRHERSDAEREFVRPLLPEFLAGRKRLDDPVLNAMVRKFPTGTCTAWRDVPERYGPRATPHPLPPPGAGRHLRAHAPGHPGQGDAAGDIDWLMPVDTTVVRAHQHAAGTRNPLPSAAVAGSGTRNSCLFAQELDLLSRGRPALTKPYEVLAQGGSYGSWKRYRLHCCRLRAPELPAQIRLMADSTFRSQSVATPSSVVAARV